jgi:adenylosuccinate lyase
LFLPDYKCNNYAKQFFLELLILNNYPNMNLSLLTAISPVDGRYRTKSESYAAYFSEYALIRYRVQVEVEYFIALCEIPLKQLEQVPTDVFPKLRAIYKCFSESDAQQIKDIEKVTNHDVKAVEYFLKEKFDEPARSETRSRTRLAIKRNPPD